jgi:hypothetical protein
MWRNIQIWNRIWTHDPSVLAVSTPLDSATFVISRGSSVSIVSDYVLDHREIEGRYPAGVKNFSCSLCVQTGSGAHPASCTVGNMGPFPGVKARPGRDADRSSPSIPRSRMSRSYTSSPLKRLHDVYRECLTLQLSSTYTYGIVHEFLA